MQDPRALRGGVGEKSLRQIIETAKRVCDHCLPKDAAQISRLASDISAKTDALCELRQAGKGNTPQALALADEIKGKLTVSFNSKFKYNFKFTDLLITFPLNTM